MIRRWNTSLGHTINVSYWNFIRICVWLDFLVEVEIWLKIKCNFHWSAQKASWNALSWWWHFEWKNKNEWLQSNDFLVSLDLRTYNYSDVRRITLYAAILSHFMKRLIPWWTWKTSISRSTNKFQPVESGHQIQRVNFRLSYIRLSWIFTVKTRLRVFFFC